MKDVTKHMWRPLAVKQMSLALCRKYFLLFCPLLLSLPCEAQEPQTCAATIGQLRAMLNDQAFPLKWEETTMDDGKPLMVSILEMDGHLFLEFVKTSEGLWAQSFGVICKAGESLETRFTGEQIRLGPGANWVLRLVLRGGGKFTLTRVDAGKLRIATSGWSGTFSPSSEQHLP